MSWRRARVLSSFVEQSIRETVERWLVQREFIARGLRSCEDARRTDKYVSSAAMPGQLKKMLARAKAKSKAQK